MAQLLWLLTFVGVALGENPWYCHNLDCPSFTEMKNITDNGEIVEIRHYPAQLWVSTEFDGGSFQSALDGGFERLFAYINGSNVDNEKIAMTTPVKSHVIQGRLKDKYGVSFYVPYKYQKPHDPPPKPSDSKVYIDSQSEMDVAVVSFEGFEHEREDERQKEELEKFLKKEGIRYESGDWIFAGYDPPFRLTGRHNEVWVKVDK